MNMKSNRGQEQGLMVSVESFPDIAIKHLRELCKSNKAVMGRVSTRLEQDVRAGRSLMVFGSGHSGLFALELYHRAGGASFIVPLVADFLLPTAGPPLVRMLERTAGLAQNLLSRAEPRQGEMLWIASQSGINHAAIDLAEAGRRNGLFTVAFTSLEHSRAMASRHQSGKRLFELCDEVVDLGGRVGDASVLIGEGLYAGPLSTLGSVMLGHAILVDVCAKLEKDGVRCVYASVNTADGEARNREIEKIAKKRDPLLR